MGGSLSDPYLYYGRDSAVAHAFFEFEMRRVVCYDHRHELVGDAIPSQRRHNATGSARSAKSMV